MPAMVNYMYSQTCVSGLFSNHPVLSSQTKCKFVLIFTTVRQPPASVCAFLVWLLNTGLTVFKNALKTADLQMLKNKINENKNKINGKFWSSFVQWRQLLLLTPNSVDKIVGKSLYISLHNLLRY